ncbi:serine hydrolase [Pseudoflavitalea sp. X16]|uniref:serine hydrolase n=1 Tax=Paraflavitalea devenefica TaxID=2716334 RepID=UPI00141F9E46|nr:serine hydrolase [Paraflavitalea devenefica]NII26041.1 serine hydrolase [Paraflavitalea devenefica]
MLYRLSPALLILITFILASCQSTMTPAQLKQAITSTLAQSEGQYAVAFKDLGPGTALEVNGDTSFHAASTMKTPILIEVYKQAAAGKLSLSDSILVKNEFHSIVDSSTYSLNPEDDSEKDLYTRIGTKRTLYELVYDMIIMSSNLATNIVIEYVDAKKVTQTMRDLGARDIQVLRGVEDSKAYQKKLNNTSTAHDLMVIFDKIATGQAVDSAADQAMINILLDQKFNEIIPAKLPKDVKVAHKTGNITGVQHDSGIVFLPDGRKYVLVILSKGIKDEKAAIENMARVSEMIYQYVISQ